MRYLTLFLVISLLLFLLVIGCSKEKTTEPTKETIKLGEILPMTGALAAYGPSMQNGTILVVKEINATDGILGKNMELIHKDSQTSSDVGVAAAQELLSEYSVPVIIGAAGSAISIKIATDVTIPNSVVQISGASTSPEITNLNDNGYFFRTVPSDAYQGKIIAKKAWNMGYRKAATMFVTGAYGQGLSDAFKTQFVDSLGGTVCAEVEYEYDPVQGSYATEVATAFADTPDVVILAGYVADGSVIMKDWHNGGFGGNWIFTDGLKSETFVTNVGASILKGFIGTAPTVMPSESYTNFVTAYGIEFGENPGIYAANFYDATMLIGLAIVKAGTATSLAIRDALPLVANPPGTTIRAGEFYKALEELKNGNDINYEGAAGLCNFDDAGDVSGPYEIWQIDENGEIKIIEIIP